MPISRYWRRAYTQDRLIHKTGLYDMYPSETRLVCTQHSPPPAPLISHNHHIQVQKALSGTVSCTNRAYARDTSWDGGSCVLARLMHATGLCAIGGCRIQASTRDRLVHKSGLCTRHYGNMKATMMVSGKDESYRHREVRSTAHNIPAR